MSIKLRIVGLYYNNELDYGSIEKPLEGVNGEKVPSIESVLNLATQTNSDNNVESFSYARDEGGIQKFSVTFTDSFIAPISGKQRAAGTYSMDDSLDTNPDLVWQYYITDAAGLTVTKARTRNPDAEPGELKIKDFPDVLALDGDSIVFRLVSIKTGPDGSEGNSDRASRKSIA